MNKDEQVSNLFEGAMSLYNTVDIETNGVENKYTNAQDKIKEVLNGEEPLYVPNDDPVASMLFQYLNIGYGVCGLKYLDMISNNKNIMTTAVGFALQKLNQFAEENQRLALELEELRPTEKGVEEKEYKGISE